MNCPQCSAETSVIDTRPNVNGLRRRRVCKACGFRFTTAEMIVADQRKPRTVTGTLPKKPAREAKMSRATRRTQARRRIEDMRDAWGIENDFLPTI